MQSFLTKSPRRSQAVVLFQSFEKENKINRILIPFPFLRYFSPHLVPIKKLSQFFYKHIVIYKNFFKSCA